MNSTPQSTSSGRFLFVDLLRGWAVFVMIETHIVNAVLAPHLRQEFAFTVLSFVNGLVAPSFLFCAGFGLAISLRRRWTQFIGLERPFWRYLVRILFIFVVGYSLHLPYFSLRRMEGITDQSQWISFFQVDILQVIVVGLFMVVVLAAALRNQDVLRWVLSAITLAVVFAAPVVRAMDLTAMPIWFRPYLSLQFTSQFPLFPWVSFLLCGTILGFWFMQASEANKAAEFMKRLGILACVGIVLSLVLEFLPITIYPNHNFFRASPEFFFVRLGCVVLALVGLWKMGQTRTAPASSLIALFGQESLLVYVVHLLIVYGRDYAFSFVRAFGQTLGYFECLGLFVGLTAVMYLMAYVWHRLKGWNARVAYWVQVSVLTGIVAAFIFHQ